MSYIIAERLVKQFGSGDATVSAVDNINIQIEEGEFVAIMGESGAGKSTLLGIMGAMNAPTSGRLIVDDIDIYSLRQEQQAVEAQILEGLKVFQCRRTVVLIRNRPEVYDLCWEFLLSDKFSDEFAIVARIDGVDHIAAVRIPAKLMAGPDRCNLALLLF